HKNHHPSDAISDSVYKHFLCTRRTTEGYLITASFLNMLVQLVVAPIGSGDELKFLL
ncbi:hypothetical protein MKX03_017125, partial [Papaver bracteatum]